MENINKVIKKGWKQRSDQFDLVADLKDNHVHQYGSVWISAGHW